jgi:hypothetical protein
VVGVVCCVVADSSREVKREEEEFGRALRFNTSIEGVKD